MSINDVSSNDVGISSLPRKTELAEKLAPACRELLGLYSAPAGGPTLGTASSRKTEMKPSVKLVFPTLIWASARLEGKVARRAKNSLLREIYERL